MSNPNKLFVRSLAFTTTSSTLERVFGQFGPLIEAKVQYDRVDPSKSRGFAFVSYVNAADAETARQAMNNADIDGRRINVDFSQPSGDRSVGDRPGFDRPAHHDRFAGDRPPPERANLPTQRGARSRSPPRFAAPARGGPPPPPAAQPHDAVEVNSRIYVTGLPASTTEDALAQHFGVIGQIARKRQKRGYADQWPWDIKLYVDDKGVFKGDATVKFEDPNAASAAPGFFDGSEFNGAIIKVEVATVKKAV